MEFYSWLHILYLGNFKMKNQIILLDLTFYLKNEKINWNILLSISYGYNDLIILTR